MNLPVRGPVRWVRGYAERLRFPQLLAVTLVLLAVDLALPDPIPLLDEAVLALLAALFAALRRRRPS